MNTLYATIWQVQNGLWTLPVPSTLHPSYYLRIEIEQGYKVTLLSAVEIKRLVILQESGSNPHLKRIMSSY